MENKKIYISRIKSFGNRLKESYYSQFQELKLSCVISKKCSIPVQDLEKETFQPIKQGDVWGQLWDSAWFKMEGSLPENPKNREVVALIDLEGEAALFRGNSPIQGLTHKHNSFVYHKKRRYFLEPEDINQGKVTLLVEAAANEIIGSWGRNEFRVAQAQLALFDREAWNFSLDFNFLTELMEAQSEKSVLKERILRGLNQVINLWSHDKEQARNILDKLLSLDSNPADLKAFSIGHGHLDIAWLWRTKETRRKAGRTFSTALTLLKEYPDAVFGASQPLLYSWVKEDYPELYSRIKEAVKEGRWECQGAMWVEPDTNIPSGESLIRHCLYGMDFYQKEFAVEVNNLWLPDVFGYTASLPGILKGCGIETFLTTKLAWSETNTFPMDTFLWQGIDGSSVLTHLPPGKEYHTENFPKQLIFAQEEYKEKGICDEFINLYGIGDGGGGPSRHHLEYAKRCQNQNGVPPLVHGTSREFFDRLENIREELPHWKGELYLEFHRGTYTSQSRIKKLNRQVENSLRNLDTLSVFFNTKIPNENLWKTLLNNQFHDILPGSSIHEANEDAERELTEALTSSKKEIHTILSENFSLTEKDTSGRLLINTLDIPRKVFIQRQGEYYEAHVPAMGYCVTELTTPVTGTVEGSVTCLKNSEVCYTLSPDTGEITGIEYKGTPWPVENANVLTLWEDEPPRWDAWDISHYYRETKPQKAKLESQRVLEMSSVQMTVEQTLIIGNSRVIQRLTLEEGSPLLTIQCTVDWKEKRKMLRAETQTSITAHEASYEIPFGHIKRSTLMNNSWEKAMFEVPGHRFADLSDHRGGLALINDSKYGYSSKDGSLDLTLLRSALDPDPSGEEGKHSFSYGYLPHEGVLEKCDVIETAHSFNSPVLIYNCDSSPQKKSFYSLKGSGVKLETVKHSHEGDDIVLRLYETRGCNASVSLMSSHPWKELSSCNHVEHNRIKIRSEGTSAELIFAPFEIKTLILKK